MLLNIIRSGDIASALIQAVLCLPIILIALSVHELAHGYVSNRLGDPTAKLSGRLTLNPLAHIDPIGFICMMLFGVGWAKPVPINPGYYKKQKFGTAITSLAGPLSNIILGFVSTLFYMLVIKIAVAFGVMAVFNGAIYFTVSKGFIYNLLNQTLTFFNLSIYLNIGLAVFNLIPIPPLDGSKILYAFLPDRVIYKIIPYEKYIQLGLFVLLFAGVLSTPISYFQSLIVQLFKSFGSVIFGL